MTSGSQPGCAEFPPGRTDSSAHPWLLQPRQEPRRSQQFCTRSAPQSRSKRARETEYSASSATLIKNSHMIQASDSDDSGYRSPFEIHTSGTDSCKSGAANSRSGSRSPTEDIFSRLNLHDPAALEDMVAPRRTSPLAPDRPPVLSIAGGRAVESKAQWIQRIPVSIRYGRGNCRRSVVFVARS